VFKYEGNNFSLIPNSEGQAWNIKINNKYIIGHNEGTYISVSKLNNINGGWNLIKSTILMSGISRLVTAVF
jgi:hypothetical protein